MLDYNEDRLASVIFRWNGGVGLRALTWALPAACLAPLLLLLDDLAPDVRDSQGLVSGGAQGLANSQGVTSSVLWSSMTACVVLMLAFRSNQALSRFWEGTGLLHQMRGEWFDAASCLMTFSRAASKGGRPDEVAEFRQTLTRLFSLMHGSALEEIQHNHPQSYEVIDIRGIDPRTRDYLKECKDEHGYNRVEVLLHMIQVLVTQNLDDGVLKIAPPILSRCYQTLSRGLVNLLNARKITDTKFPFPYAQLISILLVVHALVTPIVVSALIKNKVWAAFFAFMPVFGVFSLNFIAIELEAPFGEDENDLPLKHFQEEMNRSLLMLLGDDADHLAHMAPKAVRDVGTLKRSMTGSSTAALDRVRSLVPADSFTSSKQKPAAESDTQKPEPASRIDASEIEMVWADAVEASITDPTLMPQASQKGPPATAEAPNSPIHIVVFPGDAHKAVDTHVGGHLVTEETLLETTGGDSARADRALLDFDLKLMQWLEELSRHTAATAQLTDAVIKLNYNSVTDLGSLNSVMDLGSL